MLWLPNAVVQKIAANVYFVSDLWTLNTFWQVETIRSNVTSGKFDILEKKNDFEQKLKIKLQERRNSDALGELKNNTHDRHISNDFLDDYIDEERCLKNSMQMEARAKNRSIMNKCECHLVV